MIHSEIGTWRTDQYQKGVGIGVADFRVPTHRPDLLLFSCCQTDSKFLFEGRKVFPLNVYLAKLSIILNYCDIKYCQLFNYLVLGLKKLCSQINIFSEKPQNTLGLTAKPKNVFVVWDCSMSLSHIQEPTEPLFS